MRKVLAAVVLALAAVSVAFAGAGAEAKPAVNEWTIPFLNCLTGELASYGELFQWSAERAAQEINDAGGIRGKPVRIVGVDTGSDPQKGTVEMAKLVKDALVTMGPVPEAVIAAAMPIAVEAKMMSMTAATSLEFAQPYFPWTISWFPVTIDALPPVIAGWASQFPTMKTAIQFIEPHGPWLGMADAHAKGLQGLGITVLDKVEVPSDAVTFGPLVVKALNAKPDGIVLVCGGEKSARIVKELKSRGWTAMDHILAFSSADVPELYATGGSDIDGIQIYGFINPDISNPRWNAVKEAYTKKFGIPAPSLITNYYDAVYMIKEAIDKTGATGDPKKLAQERKMIADYCANVKSFQGVMFNWDMKDGIPTNKPVYIFSIQDGQKKLVKEVRP
jgi:branched-chain amino acid transport system substrate-binding protein